MPYCWSLSSNWPLNSEPLSESIKRGGGGRQELTEGFEREGGLSAGWGTGGEGDCEAAVGVDEGEQVAADAVADADHGIAGEDRERGVFLSFGLAVFAVPSHGFASSLVRKSGRRMTHLMRVFGDDPADRGDAGQGDSVLPAPVGQ